MSNMLASDLFISYYLKVKYILVTLSAVFFIFVAIVLFSLFRHTSIPDLTDLQYEVLYEAKTGQIVFFDFDQSKENIIFAYSTAANPNTDPNGQGGSYWRKPMDIFQLNIKSKMVRRLDTITFNQPPVKFPDKLLVKAISSTSTNKNLSPAVNLESALDRFILDTTVDATEHISIEPGTALCGINCTKKYFIFNLNEKKFVLKKSDSEKFFPSLIRAQSGYLTDKNGNLILLLNDHKIISVE